MRLSSTLLATLVMAFFVLPPQNLALGKASRGSSFPDLTSKAASTYAFSAVDGNPTTAWSSRPDGVTEGNEPVPADSKPSCQIDLGKTAGLKRIEILGQLGADVAVSVSSTADFTGSKPLAISKVTAVPSLEIKKAAYGKGGQVAYVTAKARQAADNGVLILKADSALSGSDPAPDIVKELRIEFALNGKDKVKTAAEGETLTIGQAEA